MAQSQKKKSKLKQRQSVLGTWGIGLGEGPAFEPMEPVRRSRHCFEAM